MKKKLTSDVFFNMLAVFIPMFVLQFFILPQVALQISGEEYGQLITLVAFMGLSGTIFGSVLNNSKLIHFKKYEEMNIMGDYNVILVVFIVFNIALTFMGIVFYDAFKNFYLGGGLIVASTLFVLITYLKVDFRIKLDYKKIFISDIFLFIGYILGFVLFLLTKLWIFIYIFGFGISAIYIIRKTTLLKEPIKKTILFKATVSQTLLLFVSGILLALGTYLDRLLIFPLLGGEAVSIYYTASLLGKTIGLAIGPITGVMLSYFAHMENFSRKNFKFLLGISLLVGTISFFIVILISPYLLKMIYPQFYLEALNYIKITTLSGILLVITVLVNSVLLKFYHAKWQVIANGVYLLAYIALSIILLKLHGLMGFCIGILIASIFKLILMIMIYYLGNSKTSHCDTRLL